MFRCHYVYCLPNLYWDSITLQDVQESVSVGVRVTVRCNCGQLLHHQLPHWFHSFGTKYSELTLDTRGITLSMRTHLFPFFMFHYVAAVV